MSEPIDLLAALVRSLDNARMDRAERDAARVRAELRDRLDRCDDHDHGAAFGWLADNHPDLVREALDETGAPS